MIELEIFSFYGIETTSKGIIAIYDYNEYILI